MFCGVDFEPLHRLLPLLAAAQFLPHGQLFDGLPAALLAIRPGRRRRERWKVSTVLQQPTQMDQLIDQFPHPALVWLRRGRLETNNLPVGK